MSFIVLYKTKLSQKPFLKFYKTLVVPIFLYCCETWILGKREERMIHAAELKFPRSVQNYSLLRNGMRKPNRS